MLCKDYRKILGEELCKGKCLWIPVGLVPFLRFGGGNKTESGLMWNLMMKL